MKRWKVTLALVLIPVILYGQGLPIKGGSTSDLATVDTNKNLRVDFGASARPTYIVNAGGLATTALYNMSVESAAGTGFKLAGWCVGVSQATAAALVTVTVQRRTTASSAGTACTNEGTGASCNVAKMDPADANYTGLAKVTATLGTAGAILDQVGFTVGEIGAGTADVSSLGPFCRYYTGQGVKIPTVSAGTGNGISVNVSAPGAGGLASGSISMIIIQE